MSQITRIRTRKNKTLFVERDLLIQALEDLDLAWHEDGRIGFFGPRVDLKLKRFNAGFRKDGNRYTLVHRGRTNPGFSLQELTKRYLYRAARAKLEAQGFALAREEVEQDGQIHLVLRRMV